MPTLYGAWMGTGYKARITCAYTLAYNASRTVGTFDGSFAIEFGGSVSDSDNTWSTSGDLADQSGSDVSYSIPSGGGAKTFCNWPAFTKQADARVIGAVGGIAAVGNGTINGDFTLPVGNLAPYLNNSDYYATSIAATSFRTYGLSATGNGDPIVNSQIEYNTAQSDSGAGYVTASGYTNISVSGLKPNTLYYFRMRVKNTNYWSAWGMWKSVRTLATGPSAPTTAWTVTNIQQTSANIIGNAVTTDGGSPLTDWNVVYGLTQEEADNTSLTSGNGSTVPTMVDLLPGSVYYTKIRAKNAVGWGPYSPYKSFTTLPGVFVMADGNWKNAIPFINVDGNWKQAVRFVKVDGVWKQ